MNSTIGSNSSAVCNRTSTDTHQYSFASNLSERLFNKLDRDGQGFVDRSEAKSAFARIADSKRNAVDADVDDFFARFDGNRDGHITREEMASGVQRLADALQTLFDAIRLNSQGGNTSTTYSLASPRPSLQTIERPDNVGVTPQPTAQPSRKAELPDNKPSNLVVRVEIDVNQAKGKVDHHGESTNHTNREHAHRREGHETTASRTSSGHCGEARVLQVVAQLTQAYGRCDRGQEHGGAARHVTEVA